MPPIVACQPYPPQSPPRNRARAPPQLLADTCRCSSRYGCRSRVRRPVQQRRRCRAASPDRAVPTAPAPIRLVTAAPLPSLAATPAVAHAAGAVVPTMGSAISDSVVGVFLPQPPVDARGFKRARAPSPAAPARAGGPEPAAKRAQVGPSFYVCPSGDCPGCAVCPRQVRPAASAAAAPVPSPPGAGGGGVGAPLPLPLPPQELAPEAAADVELLTCVCGFCSTDLGVFAAHTLDCGDARARVCPRQVRPAAAAAPTPDLPPISIIGAPPNLPNPLNS